MISEQGIREAGERAVGLAVSIMTLCWSEHDRAENALLANELVREAGSHASTAAITLLARCLTNKNVGPAAVRRVGDQMIESAVQNVARYRQEKKNGEGDA